MVSLKALATVTLVTVLAGCDSDDGRSVVSSGGSAVEGSGVLVTRTEDVSDFDELEISNTFNATVVQGDSFSVNLRVDDNIVEHLRVERIGSTLRVGLRDGNYNNLTAEATVVMPDIERLSLSGVTPAQISGFAFEHDLAIKCSGVSSISGSASAGEVEMTVSGVSSVQLDGSATSLDLEVSGVSVARLEDFPVARATVVLSGVSSAVLRVGDTLSVTASGTSNLSFHGTPSVEMVSISGGATVTSLD